MTSPNSEKNDAALAVRLRISIARLTRLSRSATRAADLTPSQLSVLAAVEGSPGLRIGDLSANQALSAPTATRIVQGLVERRLLDRRIDQADKRASIIALTEAGSEALAAVRSETADLITSRLGDLSRADRTKLYLAIEALERLAGVEPPR